MTEKRFNLISDNNLQLYDFIEDNGKVIHTTKVVDLLNELVDENEQLKDEVYDELDDALTVLCELYEFMPLSSQTKINSLFNRLKSLRDDMND